MTINKTWIYRTRTCQRINNLVLIRSENSRRVKIIRFKSKMEFQQDKILMLLCLSKLNKQRVAFKILEKSIKLRRQIPPVRMVSKRNTNLLKMSFLISLLLSSDNNGKQQKTSPPRSAKLWKVPYLSWKQIWSILHRSS